MACDALSWLTVYVLNKYYILTALPHEDSLHHIWEKRGRVKHIIDFYSLSGSGVWFDAGGSDRV